MKHCPRNKNMFKRKLEALGINEKLADKIFKDQISSIGKKKRFKTTNRKMSRQSTSTQGKPSNLIISKRGINYILKKQAQLIGKKKD